MIYFEQKVREGLAAIVSGEDDANRAAAARAAAENLDKDFVARSWREGRSAEDCIAALLGKKK